MRMVLPFLLALVGVGALASLEGFQAADKDKPKFSIQDVMQQAHEGGLLKVVVEGKAKDKDKKELLEMYIALSQNKPPQGTEKSWKEKTGPIVAAAKDVVAGKKGAEAALKKAVDCKGCHAAHK
jgi:hypothetical protein